MEINFSDFHNYPSPQQERIFERQGFNPMAMEPRDDRRFMLSCPKRTFDQQPNEPYNIPEMHFIESQRFILERSYPRFLPAYIPSHPRIPYTEPIREEFIVEDNPSRRIYPVMISAREFSHARMELTSREHSPPEFDYEKTASRIRDRELPLRREMDELNFHFQEPFEERRPSRHPSLRQPRRYNFTVERSQPIVMVVHHQKTDRPFFRSDGPSERQRLDYPEERDIRRPTFRRSRSMEDVPDAVLRHEISSLLVGLQNLGKDLQRLSTTAWESAEDAKNGKEIKNVVTIQEIFCENIKQQHTSVEHFDVRSAVTEDQISLETSAKKSEKATPTSFWDHKGSDTDTTAAIEDLLKHPLVAAASAPEESDVFSAAFRKRLNTAPSGPVLRKTVVHTQTVVTRVTKRRRATLGAKDLSRGDPIILKVPVETSEDTPTKKVSLIPADFDRPLQSETYRKRLASFLRRNPHVDHEDFPVFLVHKVFSGLKNSN